MKHTPTPWIKEGNNIITENGQDVADSLWEHDAEHIVRAVNSHDELLQAAKSYVRTLEFLEKTLDADGMSQHMLKNLLIEKIKKAEGK